MSVPLASQLRQAPFFWAALVFAFFSSGYWLLVAADRYVSEARVTLSRADLSSGQAMDFASLLSGATGNNRADQLLLRDHLRSLDILQTLESELQLRAHYSSHGDWFSRLREAEAPIERLHRYFKRRVSIELDEFAGVLVIRAQAYTPDMAQAIASRLLAEGERHMNAMGHELAQEQVRFLEAQVTELNERAQASRAALLAFQNRMGLVSPQATAENFAAIVARLEGQLAELQIRRTSLESFLQPQSAPLVEVNSQIAAVERQLARERARLAAPQGGTLNTTVEAFQRLQFEAEFAQNVLTTALTSLERGRVDAARTLKKVQVLQAPNLPEYPLQPRRLYNTAVFVLGALLLAGVLQLLLAIVRDHKD